MQRPPRWQKSRRNLPFWADKAKDFQTPSDRARDSTTVSSELLKLMGGGGMDGTFVPHLRLLPVPELGSSEVSPSGWTEGGLGVDENPELLTRVVWTRS